MRSRSAGCALLRLTLLAVTAVAGCRSGSKPLPGGSAPAGDAAWGGLQVEQVSSLSSEQQGGTAVVLIHGWGASGDDLVPLARELLQVPGRRFLLPAGHLAHPAGGRMWWPLDLEARNRALAAGKERDLSAEIPPGLAEARARVQALLREVNKRYRPEMLVVAGFSQGGMLAMDVALAADPPVDRVVSLSGTLVAEPLWRKGMAAAHKPPVLLSHGRSDGILPFSVTERLHALLKEHGFPVTFVPFEGGHTIPPEVVQAFDRFLNK